MTWAVSSDTERAVRVELLHRESKTQLRPPRTLAKAEWPPNYDEVLVWRRAQLARYEVDPEFLNNAKRFYAKGVKGCIAFINHWCDTFDTRETGFGAVSKGKSEGAWMPFILFTRQDELVQFILECIEDNEAGLVEKCRTMGASWVCVAISVWLWLFHPGTSIGWGSQKAENVDEIGNPKSIFWKIRELIKRLPKCFVPQNLSDSDIKQMLCHNPENESTIAGEVGDNIGRGGRTVYSSRDESAHLRCTQS
jgi:phage terminase large subunit